MESKIEHGEPDSEPKTLLLRVLVVDDNEASAKTLGWSIEIFGHTVERAHSGEEAIEKALQFRPHVILMDLSLKGMTGYDACHLMRSKPEFQNTLFIAQTGWSEEKYRQRSREAGFSYHMVKPVDMILLEQILVSHSALVGGDIP